LSRLEGSSFLDEVFEIALHQEQPTIKGFRISLDKNIEWEERNAALGQIAYLVLVLAGKFKILLP